MNPSAPPHPYYNNPAAYMHVPANAANGRPIVMFQPLTYEEHVQLQRQMYESRRLFIEKNLKENLPVKYMVIHMIILLIICIAEIGLQIANIINNGAVNYIGSGIWGAAFGFAVIGTTAFLSK